MASALIHIAVAKKVLEKVKVDNPKDYFLGSIAPDIAKQIGETKDKGHFIINTKENIPNLKIFTKRYPTFKYNSFELGYFTHLYADKIWWEEFIPSFMNNNSIKLLDGSIIEATSDEAINLIYSDYTNLNIKLIEDYDLDLSLFYEEFTPPKTTLNEIPVDKLDILINKMGILIENSKETKAYTFDIYSINNFIDKVSKEIIKEIKNTN